MDYNSKCEYCDRIERDLSMYKAMEVNKYSLYQVDDLAQIRQELCQHMNGCKIKNNCKAHQLISMIDEDPDIRSKKGL